MLTRITKQKEVFKQDDKNKLLAQSYLISHHEQQTYHLQQPSTLGLLSTDTQCLKVKGNQKEAITIIKLHDQMLLTVPCSQECYIMSSTQDCY